MSKQRIASFDGIRALAILCVLGTHTAQRLGWKYTFPDGVGMFFVLSGFLITSLLRREWESTRKIRLSSFYVRRFFRIVLPLYAYLIVVLLLCAVFNIPMRAMLIVKSALFFQNYGHESLVLAEHTWSLAVEEQFYIVWPLMFVFAITRWGRRGALIGALGMILAAPLLRCVIAAAPGLEDMIHRMSFFTLTRMDSLGVGCALALLTGTRRFEALYKRFSPAWPLALVYTLTATDILRRISLHLLHSVGWTIDACAVGCFIVWASRNADHPVGRVLNHPVIVRVGVLSYSIYLWQTLFIHEGTGIRYLNAWPVNLLLLVVMALASYYFVEQPSLTLRNRVLASRSYHQAIDAFRKGTYREFVRSRAGTEISRDSTVAS